MRARLLALMLVAVGLSVWGVSVASAAGSMPPDYLGYPVQGASVGSLSANAVRGTRFWTPSLGEEFTIGTVRAYLVGNGTPQSVSASIYLSNHDDGQPNRLVGRSDPQTLGFVGGRWVDFTLTTGTHLFENRWYYILLHSGGPEGALSIAYDDTGFLSRSIFTPLPYPSMPDPFSPPITDFSTRTYSLYTVADAALPESLAPPAITVSASAGPGTHLLSVSNGSWRSDTALTYSYQWQRCPGELAPPYLGYIAPEEWCSDIAGATGQTLAVVPDGPFSIFRAVVTARNTRGQVAVGTQPFWLGPASLTLPSITGPNPIVPGPNTLVASPGTWSSDPADGPVRFTYQWQSCWVDSPGDCTDIAGATGPTYVHTPTSSTYVLYRVVVTARNNVGTSAPVRGPLEPFGASIGLTNTVTPAVSGTTVVGQTLSSTVGTWLGLSSPHNLGNIGDFFRVQWERCVTPTTLCSEIPGASTAVPVNVPSSSARSAYVVQTSDIGSWLRARVTAYQRGSTYPSSTLTVWTAAVGPVRAPAAPVNVTLPSISGPATIVPGPNTLTASPGTWSSDPADGPVSFTYQWRTCAPDMPSVCEDVPGATAATYVHTPTIATFVLYQVVVAAANSVGSSAPVAGPLEPTRGFVASVALTSIEPPAISGLPVVGQSVQSSLGTWLGLARPYQGTNFGDAIRVQWERCTTATAGCSDIPGALSAFSMGSATAASTRSTYVAQEADLGHWLRVRVTAYRGGIGNCSPPGEPCGLTVWSVVVGPVTATVLPPSGGGGGGGGGGYPADLALVMSASRSTAAAGDMVLYVVQVRVKNFAATSGVSRALVTDVLPAGVELVSTRVNRGPGCSGTRTVSCDLDFLSGEIVGTVEIVVRVTSAGTLVNTASVSAPEADPDLVNNVASVTVVAPAPLTPPVVVAAPRLTHRPVVADAVVRAVRVGAVAAVSTQVAVDRKATVRLAVRDPRTGKALMVQAGSRLATVTTTQKASAVTASIPAARVFALKVLLPAKQIARGKAYVLVLTATGATGKTSQLQIRFLG